MKLRAEGISKRWMRNMGTANFFEAVKPVDFELSEGQISVLLGRSGSGKTTFLNMLSGLLLPSQGRVLADETSLYDMQDEALSRFRNTHFGVMPQGQAAVYSLSVLENIMLPGTLYGGDGPREEALALMERLGIAELADAAPASLSGGELRRMNIARALCMHPDFLLADEPTGDLDDENTELVLTMLREEARRGAAVLLVTHETEAVRFGDCLYRMNAGVLTKETDQGEENAQ